MGIITCQLLGNCCSGPCVLDACRSGLEGVQRVEGLIWIEEIGDRRQETGDRRQESPATAQRCNGHEDRSYVAPLRET